MKLKEISLSPFGSFEDQTLTLEQEKGFHLFYGPNEAGKSTLLRAITGFFYGIPANTSDAHSYPPNKLRVGAVITNDRSEIREFRRRKGNKDTLLDVDGKAIAEGELASYLKGIDRELFSTMFGLNHMDLKSGGQTLLASGGAVGESLFAAATGITDLKSILTEIEKDASTIFSRSSGSLLKKTLTRYKELREQVQDASLEGRKWEEQERQFQNEAKTLEDLASKMAELYRERNRLERMQGSLPLIALRGEKLFEYEQMAGTVIIDEETVEKRRALVKTLDISQERIKRSQEEINKYQQALNDINIPGGILERATGISDLNQRLDSYRTWQRELPQIQGEIKQLEQTCLIAVKEILPEAQSLAELERLRPVHDVKAQVKLLGNTHLTLTQKLKLGEEELRLSYQKMEELEDDKKLLGEAVDHAELKKVVNEIRREGKMEALLFQQRLDRSVLEEALLSSIQRLPLWQGSDAQLTELSLPLVETVKIYQQNLRGLEERRGTLEAIILGLEEEIAKTEQDISKMDAMQNVPTEVALTALRLHREQGWRLVRRAWLEHHTNEEEETAYDSVYPLHEAYERSVNEADRMADDMFHEAASVAKKQVLLQAVSQSKNKCQEAFAQRQMLDQELERYLKKWQELWASCGLSPLLPTEMLEWMDQVNGVLLQIEKRREVDNNILRLEERVSQCRSLLLDLLKQNDSKDVANEDSLELLLSQSEVRCEEADQSRARREQLRREQGQARERYQLAVLQRESAEVERLNWQEQWAKAMQAMYLSPDQMPEVVLLRMEKIDDLIQRYDQLQNLKNQAQGMRQNAKRFEEESHLLSVTISPGLIQLPAENAVLELAAKLSKAREDQIVRDNLIRQIKQENENMEIAQQEVVASTGELQKLLDHAGCHTQAELEQAEKRSREYASLVEKLEGIKEQLVAGGKGLSLEEILQEAEGVQPDLLPAQIEEINHALQESQEQRSLLDQKFGITRVAYEEKIQGISMAASDAQMEVQSKLSEIEELAHDYLRVKIAGIILRRAIEQYRQQNQGNLIHRAGEILSQITCGNFCGLKVDYDEKDNPFLVAIRDTKQEVGVDGMSDGTQDQLYLALRVAAIEQYLQTGDPIPLIVDDILINFDDERSGQTLKLLGDLSQRTQVIFFTHHRSLMDLAQQTVPESSLAVYELGRNSHG